MVPPATLGRLGRLGRLRLRLLWAAGATLTATCGAPDDGPPPATLRLPTGAALSPGGDWLFVANSNLDRRDPSGSLVAIDLRALDAALGDPRPPLCDPPASGPITCDVGALIDDSQLPRLPTGAGNIVLDQPFGAEGILRLLIASSIDRAITWIDGDLDAPGGPELRCNRDPSGACDPLHTLTHRFNNPQSSALPKDAARLYLPPGEAPRYAYLPHLTGSVISLIDLRGTQGPAISDIEGEFFRSDPFRETAYAGGFAVAELPCDPAAPSTLSRDCTWPHLVTSHRFWPGLRQFTVAPSASLIVGSSNRGIQDANPAAADDLPYLGDLAFEDPSGERLLVVSTTPAKLLRLDSSLDPAGDPRLETIATVDLCRNPNILAIDRPAAGPGLALVSCYADDQVAAVDLDTLRLVKSIDVGEGPNELVIDDLRRRLYVVETLGHAIAIVDLSPTSSRYLEVIARLSAP